jgi:hypothetical protein
MSHQHNIMALAFIAFWFLTQANSTKSLTGYLCRSLVVSVYSVAISWQGHDKIYSNLEWFADGLVLLHFCDVVSFFKPDRCGLITRRAYG